MPLYNSIDHVMLRLLAAEPLFDLFSQTFELPVAWPLQRTEFATYGWVHVGNTQLEFWAATRNDDLPSHARPPLFHGFALEPALPLHETLERIRPVGITCKPARAFQTKNALGELVTNFTNSVLLDLSEPSCCVFLCEWGAHATIYPWDEPITPVQRRAQHQRALLDKNGGPLGLVGLHAIRLETPHWQEHYRQWQALTGSHHHPLTLVPGVFLDLVPGEHLRIESLSFTVRALEVARVFLRRRGLLQVDTGNVLSVSCDGLQVRLVEPAA